MGPHHKEIALLLQNPLLAIAAPREHAKSTFIDIIVTLWELCYQKFHYQIFIGDTAAQSEQNLATVSKELETNELLIEDFGFLKPAEPEKWTDRGIITSTDIKIEAIGSGSKIRGRRHRQYRPDRIVGDDIENDENVGTKEQREKLMRWWLSAVVNAIDHEHGIIRLIGTILHFDSLLANILAEDKHKQWTKRLYKAINEGPNGPYPLWPERWPLDALLLRKATVGSVIFDQEMQNQPISDETAIIKRSWIRYHKGYKPEEVKEWKKVLRLDPAISQSETADHFALVVLGIDAHKNIYQLDRFSGRLPFRTQVQTAFHYAEKWSAGAPSNLEIHVEDNAYQAALKQEVETISRETERYWNVRGIKTHKDKTTRLTAQSGVIEGGYVTFNPAHTDLIDELCNFGKTRYDDLMDAFIGALEGVRTSTPGFLGFMETQAKATLNSPAQSIINQFGRQLT